MTQAPIAAATEEDLEASDVVIRLVVPSAVAPYVPPGQPEIVGDHFHPSTEDEKDAALTGKPIRVTVWDSARTSVEEARTIHGRSDTFPGWLRVTDVNQVRELESAPRLRVVRCPLIEPLPGSNGHCGIEGLDRRHGETRPKYKSIRDALAARATTAPPR